MWCDIFHLFLGWNKKKETRKGGNFRLNINIKGHIADLQCLFRYLRKKACPSRKKDIYFTDNIVPLAS